MKMTNPSSQECLHMRQQYYFQGRSCEANGDLQGAIEAYNIYSTWLKEEDQHIPHQWIAEMHAELGNQEEALKHLMIYAKGCTPPRAAEVYKEVGKSYEKMGQFNPAIQAYELACEVYPQAGLKKKIDELKKR